MTGEAAGERSGLPGLARRTAGLAGWRRRGVAAALGALAVAAQPPFFAIPVLIVSFAGLVWLLDGAATRRRAFADGWFFGAGYFGAGLYWVSNAMLVDPARFGWMIPFALLGLSFGLGLFAGAATFLARLAWPRSPAGNIGRALLLAAAWTALEWVRGVVLTGFPWNPVGNVWTGWAPVLQAAAWTGVYGLSAVTVFAAAGFAVLDAPLPRRRLASLSGLAVLAAIAAAGAARLPAGAQPDVPGVKLRLVQPNIAQTDKWQPGARARNFGLLLRLSGPAGGAADGVTDVVWPETAAPFGVTTDAADRDVLRRVIPPGGQLITGAPRYRFANGRLVQVWNSLVAVDGGGAVDGVYDKHHLVPFGEYVPLRGILPIAKLTEGTIDFSAGPGRTTMRLPGLPPFSPLICYEAIFPGAVVREDDRPAWMLNITNDGWFGVSTGPHQHFASAQMRAVEEGMPLVRAANTGISGVVDSYGRVVRKTALGARAVIDVALPQSLNTATLFGEYGNFAAGAVALVMAVTGIFFSRFKYF